MATDKVQLSVMQEHISHLSYCFPRTPWGLTYRKLIVMYVIMLLLSSEIVQTRTVCERCLIIHPRADGTVIIRYVFFDWRRSGKWETAHFRLLSALLRVNRFCSWRWKWTAIMWSITSCSHDECFSCLRSLGQLQLYHHVWRPCR